MPLLVAAFHDVRCCPTTVHRTASPDGCTRGFRAEDMICPKCCTTTVVLWYSRHIPSAVPSVVKQKVTLSKCSFTLSDIVREQFHATRDRFVSCAPLPPSYTTALIGLTSLLFAFSSMMGRLYCTGRRDPTYSRATTPPFAPVYATLIIVGLTVSGIRRRVNPNAPHKKCRRLRLAPSWWRKTFY